MTGLTDKQALTLSTTMAFIEREGGSPTIRELTKAIGLSSRNGAECHLKGLEKKGFIVRPPGLPRSIRVLRNAAGRTVTLRHVEVKEESEDA